MEEEGIYGSTINFQLITMAVRWEGCHRLTKLRLKTKFKKEYKLDSG